MQGDTDSDFYKEQEHESYREKEVKYSILVSFLAN